MKVIYILYILGVGQAGQFDNALTCYNTANAYNQRAGQQVAFCESVSQPSSYQWR
jgi:hypothetical protein